MSATWVVAFQDLQPRSEDHDVWRRDGRLELTPPGLSPAANEDGHGVFLWEMFGGQLT